ncbi:MAG: C-terminal binding protein [Natronomonas sp.]|uniref:C-terminal binding protein n=1 Tax=Natronomonas sp. TaxID=2184060 RepID=UPI0028704BE2|nr:C-terminal binding protein [Natronomonas sp.]MDR9431714.1 C-terminal binding protein [Natronomonas sp.]
MTYRVVFTDHTFDELDVERGILSDLDVEVIDGERSEASNEELAEGADGLLVMFDTVDAALMDAMPDCRIISRTGIGLDNVDVEAATERGIFVTNVPDYCIPEVSDHALALMLSLSRKVVEYEDQVHGGGWDVSEGRTMHRLETQTIGLVAFGNIARAVCEKANGFGMDVIAHDPFLSDEQIREGGAEPVEELDDLLARSDVVSVHTPLTPETEGMIDAEAFETMQESAFVVNVARGGIIDEADLADALDAGEIAGAGIDVLSEEPPSEDNPLVGRDDVILTPHAAWHSAESMIELREKAARNLRDTLAGDVPTYLVNTELIE